MKKKNKSLVKQFRSDDPSTYLTNVEQQKNLLLDTLDDQIESNKTKISNIQEKINTYGEPEIDQSINSIAESRLNYEARKFKKKSPEIFEKNNSGLAGILAVSKRVKD